MKKMLNVVNLWLFYVAGYAIAYPLRMWAEKRRGEPFEDPDFSSQKRMLIPFTVWFVGGLGVSLFVPIGSGALFYLGLLISLLGIIIVALAFHSFANQSGLTTIGIQRYTRNPNYIGWEIFFLGLTFIGWSDDIWSYLFLSYLIVTILFLHWTVLQEEKFLTGKYGESYKEYLKVTPRYIGRTKRKQR